VLHIEGASRLIGAHGISDPVEAGELMALLEQRVVLLEILRRALGQQGTYVRIGAENDVPGLQSLAVVAAGYGLAQRRLGTVSVIGPVRMDYGAAIANVRAVARALSHFVQELW